MDDVKSQIISTPLLRVLDVLLQNQTRELSDAEVAGKLSGVRRAAAHLALMRLHRMKVIRRTRMGRRCASIIDPAHAWLVPFKVALNMLAIEPLVERLRPTASKVVLFGSRANGANREESDFDLLVIASDASAVLRAVEASDVAARIQPIVKTPEEMLELESKEPVLARKIHEGVTLWER